MAGTMQWAHSERGTGWRVGTGILQDNGKWKGAMHVYSLALEFGKHTPVRLIATAVSLVPYSKYYLPV